ncbi:MAG: two-component regulator propeller domain-containing protein [Bacteroidota bacterium]
MKIWIHTIIALLALIFSFQGLSQNLNPTIEKLPSGVDLTQETITDILQDKKGFIWIATWSGLKRFDGYSVKEYSQGINDQNGLFGNKIKCLFEDSKNRLWVGTNYTGFYLYDRSLDRFIQYKKDPENMNSLSHNHVLAIHEDKEGYIWIGTENGLNRFDAENQNFVYFENSEFKEKSKGYRGVISFATTTGGELWVGCEVGLDRLIKGKNGEPDYFIRYYLAPDDVSDDDFLRHNFVYKIVPSQIEKNTLWIGTSVGLKKLTYSENNLSELSVKTYLHEKNSKEGLSHSFVSDIYEDPDRNQLWVGTFNGLNRMDIPSEKFHYYFHKKHSNTSINNNVIHALYKDQADVLWIGSDKGINQINFSSKPFRSIRFSESEIDLDLISCITLAKNDKGIWLGTNGTGLGFVPIENGKIKSDNTIHYPIKARLKEDLSGFISDVIVSNNGDVWVSTKGAGLIKIPVQDIPKRSSEIIHPEQFTMEKELEDDYLMTLIQSSDGAIWFGYWDNGIGRLDPKTNDIVHFDFTNLYELNLKEFPIVHLVETMEGNNKIVWAGSRGGGLYKMRFDDSTNELKLIKHYKFINELGKGLSNNFIDGIYKPEHLSYKHELWVGTENGLNILDLNTNTFSYINESHGLKGRTCHSIMEDKSGSIWIGTSKGISCITREGDRFEIKNFDKYDGLISDLFYDKSSVALQDGRLIFGGINGINYFLPKQIEINSAPPKVSIIDFRLFNKSVPIGNHTGTQPFLQHSISETKAINLSYRENVLSFEFAGMFSDEPQKIKYAHKLEGFHEDWIYSDATERVAHFTNLPYQDFVFKVKAANADGYWSEEVLLNLSISPPFWLTNWAYFVYALLLSALFYGVLRIIKMRTEFTHSLQLEKLEQEKLKEVNKMKLQFFTNISHELRTPLTLILSPLEQYIKEKPFEKRFHESMVRMHNNANRLLTMINQLLDIRKNDAGLMKLKVAKGNIIEFTQEVILSFKGLALQQNISLKYYFEHEDIHVWFDRNQMEKVLFNLLSNALKFTPENGKVEIFITQEEKPNGYVTIKVTDSGDGIPENQIHHIFDRFYQIEEKLKEKRKPGTGIGLALSQSIINAHHGRIWVENNKPGKGCAFSFQLSKGNSHFAENEIVTEFQNEEAIETYLTKNLIENPEAIPNSSTEEIVSNDSKEKPILLLVEDNADIRSYLKENLENRYKVLEAIDGKDGLTKANLELPDLILADISMPEMDGIEMCHRLKSDLTTSHIPIILLTARTSLIFKIDGVEKGADDYVTKPFNMQLLQARIKNLIDSRIKLREKFAKNFDLSPSGVVMNSIDEELLTRIKVVVEKNIDNSDFSVDELANSIYLSRMQLYRKLKALTGKSPNKIIREIRLQRAAQLLETKQYNVSDVTYMVGYNDLKYFRDQFKKEFGISPSEYSKS